MNSSYWAKTSIKLSTLTNSVCNLTAMAVNLKKAASNRLTKQESHAGRWSRGHASHVRQGIQGKLEREDMSSQGALTRE